jgi:hypothetical protein
MIIKKILLSLLIVVVSLAIQILISNAMWQPSLSYLRSLNLDPANIMFIMYGIKAVILILLVVGLSSYFGVYKVKFADQ